LAANAEDLAAARDLSPAMRDRLALNEARIAAIAASVDEIARIPDPLGETLESWTRPNGLSFTRVRVPIGVIGIIYESRPNVTADAGALSLRAGNAVILRCGSESLRSSLAIHAAMARALTQSNLPAACIQLVPDADRDAVGHMLSGLSGAIDLIIPRGGKNLVARVEREARVPVLGHLEGLCHTYVHEKSDPAMAAKIVFNAKMRRPGVCGATETLLIDRAILSSHLAPILAPLIGANCELRGDAEICAHEPRAKPATDADFHTEHLAPILNIRTVNGMDEAIAHIATYGTHHTEAIISEDEAAAARFTAEVDSAIVLVNASTQFADGGEFGFGAEIGIATGRLHARGPVGARELTTYKTIIKGSGQIRP
ncbi:MAG TPA: glutamate-5-semialdehyde dehydrogenase, partial [Micropepsaceae bacterium]|nr:glutamate-5-semialdehyde dehydrogenase [Micropepsaceae bacterium]